MGSLSSTTFLLHLLSVFFYFFNFLLSWTRQGNVGHMTWYRVRNIPAQLCYAPDDSQLFRALVSMHPFVPIYPGLLTFSFLLFHVFFYLQITFFYFLEFYTKKFQERSNSGWVFLLLLLLLFYFFSHFVFLLSMFFFVFVFVFFLLESPVLF